VRARAEAKLIDSASNEDTAWILIANFLEVMAESVSGICGRLLICLRLPARLNRAACILIPPSLLNVLLLQIQWLLVLLCPSSLLVFLLLRLFLILQFVLLLLLLRNSIWSLGLVSGWRR